MAVWKIAEPFKLNRTVQSKLRVVQGELFITALNHTVKLLNIYRITVMLMGAWREERGIYLLGI